MYERDLINRKELYAFLEKCRRRKGRRVVLSECRVGDVIKFEDDWRFYYVDSVGERITACNVYEASSLVKFVASIGMEKAGRTGVTLYTKPGESFIPKLGPALTTLFRVNPDGSVCCRNFVAWHEGQHFSFGSVAEFEEFRRRETAGNGGEELRRWEREEGACPRCKTSTVA